MRRGPFAFGLLLVVALVASSGAARAADNASDDPAWCVRGEADRPDRSVLSAPADGQTQTTQTTQTIAGGRQAPASPADTCIKRGLSADCQVNDPADRPTPTAPRGFGAPDLAPLIVPALPEPDQARAPLPPGVLGAARPGHVRELLRPPRV